MQEVILALLQIFRERAPDPESNAWVITLAADRDHWPGAHDLLSRMRRRCPLNDKDFKEGDRVRRSQHTFEELCLKTLYNETHPRDPFDPSSPFSVAGCAIRLARTIGVPVAEVLASVRMQANPETVCFHRVFPNYPGPAAATSLSGRLAASEEVAKEFPDLHQFPT